MADELNAVVLQRVDVAPGLMILRVAPEGWELPDFIPGQFAVIGLAGTAPRCDGSEDEEPIDKPEKLIRRAYSIASSSVAKEYLEFYVTLVQSGSLTPRLFHLQNGDRLFLGKKITGAFTLQDVPEDQHLLLLATGTGLAPYMSMLRTILPGPAERKISVIHGARHSWDLGYRDELIAMARVVPGLVYLPVITRPGNETVPWSGATGYLQDLWLDGTIAETIGGAPTPDDTHIFLCGNPAMIETALDHLVADGFSERTRKNPDGMVHVERYW